MDSSVFALPDWYKALTLSERAATLRRSPQRSPVADKALAERRLARWRGQEPFSEEDFFARRLAQDGLTEDDLRLLLAEPAEAVAARATGRPDWLLTLEEAFTQQAPETFPEVPSTSASIAFIQLVRPLLDRAYSRLTAGLREIAARHPGAPVDPETTGPLLAANLPSSLILLMSRTLVVELQLARQEGRLAGETPEERFQSFVASLREPETALAILRQYPVLARGLVRTVDRWLAVSLEILRRFAADWSDLRALFAPDADPGPLAEVRTGLGDSHRGGRTVTLFRLESGLRLIYKPKPLGVERAFQDLLDWTGGKGFAPGFRTLRLIDRGDYGWIEFIAALPCADEAAVHRFYRRQGAYIALLWLLEATDFHWENLIASGEHPVLIDLEALFQPLADELGSAGDATQVGRVLRRTVLSIGLLPSRVWAEGGGEGVDLSGLAGSGGQAAPPVLKPESPGTDDMRYTLQPVELPAGDNLPVLQGGEAGVTRFIGEVVDGFDRMMRLLLEHREELAAPEGPLQAFREAEVRIIVRPTRNYAVLFFESYHPYMVSDALDRDRMLDRLWLAAREHPLVERTIPAERGDLLRGDIPMFVTRPGTRDVWSADGERYADLQPDSGLDRVRRRLRRLDEGEIVRQSWLVRNSLAALDLSAGGHASYDFRETEPPSRAALLEAAVKIGLHLEAIALRGPHDAHWFAPQTFGPGGGGTWMLQPARLDLHLGLPGIVLFLGWLGELTGESRFTELARAGGVTLRDQVRHGREILSNIGAFSGWGGLVWTFTHLGALWEDEELLEEARRIALEEIPSLIPQDENSDLIGGAAGCLISLLTLHEVRPSERLLAEAARCGERLLARAVRRDKGIGWTLEIAGPTPLAGLSHGVAGIAWPLLRLAALTGDGRFREAALAGLEYERSLYRADKRNWPDLREGAWMEDAAEPHFMWAWCHGAPGVGLGRLAALPYLDDATVREEIEIAVESTLAHGFGGNHCLCHGDLGNLELVAMAAERLGRADWAERADRITGGILEGIRENGWFYGIPGSTESPGMMLGLAGIGYGLLRRAAPERVPSVLTLAAP